MYRPLTREIKMKTTFGKETAPGVSNTRNNIHYNTTGRSPATPKPAYVMPEYRPLRDGLDDLWWSLYDVEGSDPTAAAILCTLNEVIAARYLVEDATAFVEEAEPLLARLGPNRGEATTPADLETFTVEYLTARRHVITIFSADPDRGGWQVVGFSRRNSLEEWAMLAGMTGPAHLTIGDDGVPILRGVLPPFCCRVVDAVIRLRDHGKLKFKPIECNIGLDVGGTYSVC